MHRFDLAASAAFSAVWLLTILTLVGLLPARGLLALDLYQLFSFASVLGWLSGNLYMWRRRHAAPALRLRLLVTYLTGPLAVLFLLQAMATAGLQKSAPLAPVYAALINWLFFLVPVTLRPEPSSERLGDGPRDEERGDL